MKKTNVDLVAASNGVRLLDSNEVKAAGGLVAAANASLFASNFFSEALTTYALGWKPEDTLQALLDFIAPEVMTGRKFQFAKGVNSEMFLSESDDVRAIGSDFKRVQFSQNMTDSSTQNKGLVVYMDRDQVDGVPDAENRYTAALMTRLVRNEIRRAIALLLAGATNVAKGWNSNTDPDGDVLQQLDLSGDAVGMEPNRVLYGRGAWIKRLLAFRAQNNAGGYASAAMSTQQLTDLFGVEEVRVARERYQSSASAKSKIVGDICLIFNGQQNQLAEDASNVKRFVSMAEGGQKFRIYRQELTSKLIAITVEHYSRIVVVDSTGLRKITVT